MIITPPRFEWLFSMLDLDAAYDNTKAVAESSELLRGFEARSDVLASRFSGTMDVPYGKGAREKFDFFPGNPGAGIFVFVHDGYWQMRHKNTFRFLAKGPMLLRSAIRLRRRRAFRKSLRKYETPFTRFVSLPKIFWRIRKRLSFLGGLLADIWRR